MLIDRFKNGGVEEYDCFFGLKSPHPEIAAKAPTY